MQSVYQVLLVLRLSPLEVGTGSRAHPSPSKQSGHDKGVSESVDNLCVGAFCDGNHHVPFGPTFSCVDAVLRHIGGPVMGTVIMMTIAALVV